MIHFTYESYKTRQEEVYYRIKIEFLAKNLKKVLAKKLLRKGPNFEER